MNNKKVEYTLRNLNWLFEELEDPIPFLLNEQIKCLDVKDLSTHFEENYFDGICTEPVLGPFYKKEL